MNNTPECITKSVEQPKEYIPNEFYQTDEYISYLRDVNNQISARWNEAVNILAAKLKQKNVQQIAGTSFRYLKMSLDHTSSERIATMQLWHILDAAQFIKEHNTNP